jgi:hypothetical protein
MSLPVGGKRRVERKGGASLGFVKGHVGTATTIDLGCGQNSMAGTEKGMGLVNPPDEPMVVHQKYHLAPCRVSRVGIAPPRIRGSHCTGQYAQHNSHQGISTR